MQPRAFPPMAWKKFDMISWMRVIICGRPDQRQLAGRPAGEELGFEVLSMCRDRKAFVLLLGNGCRRKKTDRIQSPIFV